MSKTVQSRPPEFLYPTMRQFPFDEVCEQIVRELEKRNWKVPGVETEFSEYGSGDQKYRHVQQISGDEFKLHFCRKQRTMPGGQWNDVAAVTQVNIPRAELHVYEDESGPTLYLYAGDDWERDREGFVSGSKVNSKLNGKPRTYLKYKGAWSNPAKYIYPGQRPPLLVSDNDLGREYDPVVKMDAVELAPGCVVIDIESEPVQFKTADVMDGFTRWLQDHVLALILSHPIAETEPETIPAVVPFPQLTILGELFCFGEYRDAQRIKQGKADPSQLEAHERYGMQGNGYRLVPFDVSDDGTLPKIAYEGFLWCGIAPAHIVVSLSELEVPGHMRWSDRDGCVIRVRPRSGDGIYIADHGEYEQRRAEIEAFAFQTEPERTRLTGTEVAEFIRARGRTIVPITEYKGGFSKPVVLICRELGFDEVEIVEGPWFDGLLVKGASSHDAQG